MMKHVLLVVVLLWWGTGVLHASNCSDFAGTGCRIVVDVNKSFVKLTERKVTSVSISNHNIADVKLITPRQILIVASGNAGSTNMILWYGEGDDKRAEVYEVVVRISPERVMALKSQVARYVPGAVVDIQNGADGLILSGEVESQQVLDRILKVVGAYSPKITNLLILKGIQQVQLEVKIAEVSKSAMKKMGLGFLTNNSWSIGVFNSGRAEAAMKHDSDGSKTMALGSNLFSPFSSAFQIAVSNTDCDVTALLSLLKGQNVARMLATPTLVTTSGQKAEFLAGGEYPIPVSGNYNNVSIQFKKFGVMLGFTPHVIDKEAISLVVEPEISSPDYTLAIQSSGVSVPGLSTRRGKATLNLRDGQTFAMAGLLKEESTRVVNKVPFLGDLPFVGTLFTSKEYQKQEHELVILVTPRIVRPLNRNEVPALPGENMMDTIGDGDFFLLNRLRYRNRPHLDTGYPEPEPVGSVEAQTNISSPVFIGDMGYSR